jgi:hypothetical protein
LNGFEDATQLEGSLSFCALLVHWNRLSLRLEMRGWIDEAALQFPLVHNMDGKLTPSVCFL